MNVNETRVIESDSTHKMLPVSMVKSQNLQVQNQNSYIGYRDYSVNAHIPSLFCLNVSIEKNSAWSSFSFCDHETQKIYIHGLSNSNKMKMVSFNTSVS